MFGQDRPLKAPISDWKERLGRNPGPLFFAVALVGVVAAHLTLLPLPYFWDEGGYYVPAALDFYRTGTLIPEFTNAHPPLPSVILGSAWHLFGFHILVTRLVACSMAAFALTFVFTLSRPFLGTAAAVVVAVLTGCYPIWFAQSSLAHADIFAAALTLGAFSLYFTAPEHTGGMGESISSRVRLQLCCLLFCLSVLAKETAIVQPATLAVAELWFGWKKRRNAPQLAAFRRWATVLALPVPVLATWFGYHYAKTGQIFGNPVYLRYNATDNFTLTHVLYALRIRFVHLFWQRKIWVPLLLAASCLVLPGRSVRPGPRRELGLPVRVLYAIVLLVATNLVAFSVLGGALLTRYLLPVYPLVILVCVAIWRDRLTQWLWMALLTAGAFIPAIWLNPDTFFAPEDNLTYRNMIVVQQHAVDFLNQHYPQATVLTAWPVSADLFRPELGYTSRRFRVFSIENFTPAELNRAAQSPEKFDTALVFTTHYTSPSFRTFLLSHPSSWRGRRYLADLDLTPRQIASALGGDVVWQQNLYGEWAAILRFPRGYDARLDAEDATLRSALP